jgi:hypothetical protein
MNESVMHCSLDVVTADFAHHLIVTMYCGLGHASNVTFFVDVAY